MESWFEPSPLFADFKTYMKGNAPVEAVDYVVLQRGEMPPLMRNAISESLKGRPKSAETRSRMSAAQLGICKQPLSEATKAKLSAALKGRKRPPFSAETRAKMSENNRRTKKGWKQKPETIAKRVAAFKLTIAKRKNAD
jgi:hypothetical protein